MREKICCFLDNDEQYVIMLTEYINSHHALMYRAMAFTSGQALLEAMDGYDIELMVIADDLAGEPFMENVKYKSLIILSDNADNGCVDRYQPADDIIRDLIAHMSGYETILRRETDKTVMDILFLSVLNSFPDLEIYLEMTVAVCLRLFIITGPEVIMHTEKFCHAPQACRGLTILLRLIARMTLLIQLLMNQGKW